MSAKLGVISLGDLLLGFADPLEAASLTISGIALDCRQIRPGDAFVALAGQRAHGLDYLDAAVAAGAVAVLHDGRQAAPDTATVPVISVPDLNERLPELARRLWGDAGSMDLVAVTGTNGKSSVAWLLAQALDGAMIGTLGVGRPGQHRALSHTTPDVLSLHRLLAELREQGVERVVLEASSHALDQNRLAGLVFTSVIFTTLGHDHLDYHGDLAAYKAAKALLFQDYASRRQIINIDDAFGTELARRLAASPGLIRYGIQDQDPIDIHGRVLETGPNGLMVEIQLDGGLLKARSGLIGRINLYNLMIVAAELEARGLSTAQIVARIDALKPVPGRMQTLSSPGGPTVVIDYAHSPDALENVLSSLLELTPNDLYCVFGCGGDRDRAKRPIMGRIAESMADRVILTDDNPRHEEPLAIIREIQSGMRHPTRVAVVPDRAEAIRRALSEATADDVVLIAGKGHETEQQVGDERLPFSDEAVARAALELAA
jgi:UDP-N-acetylmuramoyl-L-alanyl-D-glutamate--2,6-diaminopimelate ligase